MRNTAAPSLAHALQESFRLRQEVKLLRAERSLLIDTDRARCRVLASLLDGAGIVADDVEEIDRLSRELLKLHGSPDGSKPCSCRLCRPEDAGEGDPPHAEDHTGAPGQRLAIRADVESTS